ncbi:hypothetical protein AB0K74_48255 [Streptomyces sp. NPDC056159]|uniref:hypothetical protein n=1 Tax=Streptomyces sp. NPDC056159 TaxID=3155537 RepID=UPI00342FC183
MTDHARIRDITQVLAPRWAHRLFTVREQGAAEQQLQRIAGEGFAEMYWRQQHPRHDPGVEFTDVERIDIEL